MWAAVFCGLVIAADAVAQQAPVKRNLGIRGKAKARASTPRSFASRPTWDTATLDVFFADARRELGPEPVRAPTTAPQAATNVAQTSSEWSKTISAEALEAEIKSLTPLLAEDVKSAGHFKAAGCQQARLHLAQLSVLFAMIADFDGEIRWQQGARALSGQLRAACQRCQSPTEETLRAVKVQANDLNDLVRGNVPSEAPASDSGSSTVERAMLMEWLEQVQQRQLQPWIGESRKFAAHRDALSQQAQVMAAIAQLLQQRPDDSANETAYQEQARKLQSGARMLFEAAEKNDSVAGRSAYQQIQQSCERCHADYRG